MKDITFNFKNYLQSFFGKLTNKFEETSNVKYYQHPLFLASFLSFDPSHI